MEEPDFSQTFNALSEFYEIEQMSNSMNPLLRYHTTVPHKSSVFHLVTPPFPHHLTFMS